MDSRSRPVSIKYWAEDDKPREKLLHKGRSVLSDAELVAILIGSGNREESAVALSKRILASADHSLETLGSLSIGQLMQFKGIGEAKAVTVVAALEIGRRRQGVMATKANKVENSTTVYRILYPLIGELGHEEFWILYLNNANRVLRKTQLSKGGITGTLVDVRLVLREALEIGAVSLILSHNHPSGSLRPSDSDKQLTRKLKMAAEALDIQVLDHVIVAQKDYFSFADNGIL